MLMASIRAKMKNATLRFYHGMKQAATVQDIQLHVIYYIYIYVEIMCMYRTAYVNPFAFHRAKPTLYGEFLH